MYREQGEMLFTHFGVSGPLVLSASAYVKKSTYRLEIDLKPALDDKSWTQGFCVISANSTQSRSLLL